MLTITAEELQRMIAHVESYKKFINDLQQFLLLKPSGPLPAYGTPSAVLSLPNIQKYFHYEFNLNSFVLNLTLDPPAQVSRFPIEYTSPPSSNVSEVSLQTSRNDSGYVGSSDNETMVPVQSSESSLPDSISASTENDELNSESGASEHSTSSKNTTQSRIETKDMFRNAFENIGSGSIMERFIKLQKIDFKIPVRRPLDPNAFRLENVTNQVLKCMKYAPNITAAIYLLFYWESKQSASNQRCSVRQVLKNLEVRHSGSYGQLKQAFYRGNRISSFLDGIGFKNVIAITAIPLKWSLLYETANKYQLWIALWKSLSPETVYPNQFNELHSILL